MRVVVVGAGSVGANIAFRLVVEGHDVTVLDSGRPGHGTSGTSISWLSSFPQIASVPPDDLGLRLTTHSAFQGLEAEIGGDWMHWTDTVTYASNPAVAARLHDQFERCVARGVRVEAVSGAEAKKIEPLLALPDDALAYAEHGGGWVDAPLLIQSLLAAATGRGATLREQTTVGSIEREGGRVTAVRTGAGDRIAADVVVDAAGSWASHVAAMAGCTLSLNLRPGLIVFTEPLADGPLRTVISTPILSIRPDPSGGMAVLCRPESMYSETAYSHNVANPVDTMAQAARLLPCLAETGIREARVGIRPIPPGGPVVGFHPQVEGLYVCVSHGGIGWGPTWGRVAASEIAGTDVSGLDNWRPDRFLTQKEDIAAGEAVLATEGTFH